MSSRAARGGGGRGGGAVGGVGGAGGPEHVPTGQANAVIAIDFGTYGTGTYGGGGC